MPTPNSVSPNIAEDLYEYSFFQGTAKRCNSIFFYKYCFNAGPLIPNRYLFPFTVQVDEFQAKLAVFDGGTDGSAEQNQELLRRLPSFSYLAADNSHPSDCPVSRFVSGTVHPDGYALNKVFGRTLGFEISQQNDNEFEIYFDEVFDEPPTFLVSALWFAPEGILPDNLSQLVVGVTGCDQQKCRVRTGSRTLVYTDFGFNGGFCFPSGCSESRVDDITDTPIINEYLGFSFMALPGNETFEGLIHGCVDRPPRCQEGEEGCEDTQEGQLKTNVRIQETDTYDAIAMFGPAQVFVREEDPTMPANYSDVNTDPPEPLNNTQANETFDGEPAGGVYIRFKECFDGIPSVVVTPKVVLSDSINGFSTDVNVTEEPEKLADTEYEGE